MVPGPADQQADKWEPIAFLEVKRRRRQKNNGFLRKYFLRLVAIVAFEEQTPRQASLAADAILALLHTDPDAGISRLRESSALTASIVRSYLEDELPESFRIFNPGLVARVERVRARFQK